MRPTENRIVVVELETVAAEQWRQVERLFHEASARPHLSAKRSFGPFALAMMTFVRRSSAYSSARPASAVFSRLVLVS
jgi:hypothetical protein